MPKQGVTSMFRFWENFGFIQGLLTAYSIPYELVTPGKWKKAFQFTAVFSVRQSGYGGTIEKILNQRGSPKALNEASQGKPVIKQIEQKQIAV